MPRPLAIVAIALLWGCGNPCQDICAPMASYARSCGLEVTAGDVQACKDANAGEVDDATAEVCAEMSDPQTIREWWDCETVAENMTGAQ